MNKRIILALALVLGNGALAQDLVITNARLLDGAGTDIANGTLVIEDGRIVSLSAGGPPGNTEAQVLDAAGRTLMPGFIDAHRHIINGDSEAWFAEQAEQRMREFLDAGFTTLMSGGGPVPGILELQQKIAAGEIKGPRIITSGRVDPQNFTTEGAARAEVRRLAGLGVEIIKARMNTVDEKALLSATVDEARAHGLEVMVHASSSPEIMVAAVETGAGKLVHTPHGGWVSDAQAGLVADAGVENLTCAGFGLPTFGAYNDDNVPTFRDGSPWPQAILEGGSATAGEKAVNSRTLWDNGVTLGFGTDTSYHPRDGLKHELRALNLMFSERDLLKLMGPNTAAFLDMEGELGVLAIGAHADLVLVEGDPLDGIFELLDVALVIKGGEVVSDHGNQQEAAGS